MITRPRSRGRGAASAIAHGRSRPRPSSRRARARPSTRRRCARGSSSVSTSRGRPAPITSRLRQTSRGRWAAMPLRSWVVRRIATPVALRSSSRCSTSWRRRTSTPEVGSSSSSRSGRWRSARAMNTRCCWPPESSRMWRSPSSPMPSRCSTAATSARSARLAQGSSRPSVRAIRTHWLTVTGKRPVDRLDLGHVAHPQARPPVARARRRAAGCRGWPAAARSSPSPRAPPRR